MNKSKTRTIVLGSRPSQLARWQTLHVMERLGSAWPELSFQAVTLKTEGDRILEQPLPEIGGKGVFTAELETALLSGQIDLAVHSLKDLPVDEKTGIAIGAIVERADPRDVLVSNSGQKMNNLPHASLVGTSSLRREAQLRAFRDDLVIAPLRGNIDTRLRKVQEGHYDAIILAAAGIERLGFFRSITEYLSFDVMLPAPGQGALAVQCRAGDNELLKLLEPLHHLETDRAVTAERAFLAALGGGCSAPVAAYAHRQGANLEITGLVASLDGQKVIRVSAEGQEPALLGEKLAHKALELGAGELLG